MNHEDPSRYADRILAECDQIAASIGNMKLDGKDDVVTVSRGHLFMLAQFAKLGIYSAAEAVGDISENVLAEADEAYEEQVELMQAFFPGDNGFALAVTTTSIITKNIEDRFFGIGGAQ